MFAQRLGWSLEVDWNDPLVRRRTQRGATLVEALAFLGTATVIAVNSVTLFGSAVTDAGALDITQDAALIQTGVRSLAMQDAATFVVSFANVPRAVCFAALTSAGSNWTAVGVEDGSARLVAPDELTPAMADEQCMGDTNTVEWVSD